MDFLKYDIKDNGAFAPFISTMEGTGADIEGSRVMFESDNSAAKMLADTLVEYEIMAPAMEARKAKATPAAGGEPPVAAAPAAATPAAAAPEKPAAAPKKVVAKKDAAKPAAKKPAVKKDGEGPAPAADPAKPAAPAAAGEKPAAPGAPAKVKAGKKEKPAAPAAEVKAEEKPAATGVDGVVAGEDDPKAAEKGADSDTGKKVTYSYGDGKSITVSGGKIVDIVGSKSLAGAKGATFELRKEPKVGEILYARINGKDWSTVDQPLTDIGGLPGDVAAKEGKPEAGAKEGKAAEKAPAEDPSKKEVYADIIEKVDSLGLDDRMKKMVETKITKFIDELAAKKGADASEIYQKLADNPMTVGKMVFGVIQKSDPALYEKLKEKGLVNTEGKGDNAASMTQKTELSKAISQIVGEIEVPDAFNVEIDDTEWDNALIKAFGFPMINLTSPLVREMIRAQEPKSQKRAYKEFKKQLKSDPDVAKALGIGLAGTLGLGGGKKEAATDKTTRIDTRTEGVNSDGKVLVEGPITDIANALKSPVDVLKSIAQNKGTPCRRNNLVVMYDEIDGKSGDSSEAVKVTPLGASGGTLVDLNLSVQVPMNHLTAFYSVVDPKASFKSYAKAMAEVNTKSDNAAKGLGGAAAAAGKKLLSKIPLLGRGAKKELDAEQANAETTAMGELAMYVKENGHPPFYLLKPKPEPKEIDRWSDEDAANGYQMITMNVDGHKAGMILKEKTAEALFKVG